MEELRPFITPMLYSSLATVLIIAVALVILIRDLKKEIKQYDSK